MRILKALSMAFVMSGALLWGGKTVHAAGDVSKDAWYYDAVKYVMDQKYMNGTSEKNFAPLSNLTRAQFVQVLYNMEGCPGVLAFDDATFFEDNKDPNLWYYEAVLWSVDDNIATGVDPTLFGADHMITREQIATMLYKYAIRSGEYKTTIDESALDAFPDKNKVSEWAVEALEWAVGNGIMSGKPGEKGNILDPQGKATRAECAQMIMNFKKKAGVEVPTFPEKFDLRDVIEIPVEDQGNFGLCWDFAAMKCVETNLALTKGLTYNFSEIHVGYMMSDVISPYLSLLDEYYMRTFDDGGNFEKWLEYNLAFHGFMADADLEYRIYNEAEYRQFGEMDLVPINVAKVKRFSRHYYDEMNEDYKIRKSEATVENVKRQVKDHIMKYGAVWVGVCVDGNETYLYHTYCGGNHAMAIIGWDDHIPKEKFAQEINTPNGDVMIQPKKDGGYIVLNSWGTEVCDQGIMYISYEDYNVHNELWGIVSLDDEELIDLKKEDGLSIREAIQKKYPEWVIDKDGKQYVNPSQTELYDKIDLSGCGIVSLEGIEDLRIFENCSSIDLSDNEIADLTPLKSAMFKNVKDLKLNHNKITDITALASLKELTHLEMDHNQISDISALATVKKLSYLSVRNNQLKDIGVLKNGGELKSLYLDGNKGVTGYGDLKQIKELGLSDCGLSKVENLSNLAKVDLSRNQLGNQIASVKFDNIEELLLRECGLKSAPNIERADLLDLSDNPDIKDFSALKTKNITILRLCNCNIVDGSILPTDWWINALDLSGNVGIHNLDSLGDRVNNIGLRKCGITDVSVLGYNLLSEVDLSENIGLYGRLNANKLILENCGLDDKFDFFGNDELISLDVKGNSISLEHILNNVSCGEISCDPISLEEFQMILSGEYGYVNVVADVYTTLKIPASAKDKTIQLLPIIRRYFAPNYQNLGDKHNGDLYVIEAGKDIDYDPYLLTCKMQGDHAQVTLDAKYLWSGGNDIEGYACGYRFKFILDIQAVDQLNTEKLLVYADPGYEKYYLHGDKLDLSTLKVERIYEGGYSEFIDDYEITGPEVLKFGKNEFVVKHGDVENEFVIDALAMICFKTEEVYKFFAEGLFWNVGMEYLDDEGKKIVINNDGRNFINTHPMGSVPSSMIWDLEGLKGIVSMQTIAIQYDGHKINEEDLEVLKAICSYEPLTPKANLIIYYNRGEDKEDMIVAQDTFNVEFIVNNPDILSSEEIDSDEEINSTDELNSNEEPEPELPDANVDETNLNAVEDIFDVTETIGEGINLDEINTEDPDTVENDFDELNIY